MILDPQNIRYDNRFDVGFKLLYLILRHNSYEISKDIYLRHISILTGGTFSEPGNKSKKGRDVFLESFDSIDANIRNNGFNKEISKIPFNKEGTFLNGSHRISSLLYNNLSGYAEENDSDSPHYSSEFFREAGMSKKDIDWAANALIFALKGARIFIIWPKAFESSAEVESLFSEILYIKEIETNFQGLQNIVRNVYHGETWAKEKKGIKEKSLFCSSGNQIEKLKVIVIKGEVNETHKKLKEEIRSFLGYSNHSLHSSDDHKETIRLSKILLNENFINLIPNIPLNLNNTFFKMTNKHSSKKINNSFVDYYVLTGSSILGLLNLRQCNDIDVLEYGNKVLEKYPQYGSHDNQKKYYSINIEKMIFDPENFFYFNNIKFLSIDNIIKMKTKRREPKDQGDVRLLDNFSSNSLIENYLLWFHSNIRQLQWNIKLFIIKSLKLLGIFSHVRSIYHQIKRLK